jgi:Concanavalin A-like lectin/glucanases superfamily
MPIPNSLAAGSARAFGFLGSISPSDPYFNYVTMLLPGNGTNGAQNNTFRDSSTNNLTITRNGNTTQGTFSPYGNNWSNFFDGTGDYLQAATSTAFDFGTGDFTIEFWVNFAALSSNRMLIDRWSSGDSNSWQIYWRTTGSSIAYLVGGTIVLQDPSATNIVVNAWNHVAVTRSGSTNRLFINGALVATATNSTSLTNALPLAIGVQRETLTNYFNGYISNVRILKGTALYTAAFTPPTAPLTAITNTSLLTCQSNRFIDNSTNNFTITRNGDVSVQRFSPFNPTASYAPSIDGGSGYFDGTGDSLVSASSASNILSTNDFTIEFWLYPSNTSVAYRALVSSENYSAITGGWSLYQNGAALELWVSPNSSAVITASAALTAGAWQHIALSRVSGTLRLFVNGTQAGSLGTGAAFTGQQVWIGDNNAPSFDYFVIGYMSDVRIVNGTGLYTTAFTPPTAPLTAVTNTSFLANFTNAGIIDNAEMNDLETVGNAQISTAQSKFGGGSMLFDGAGDWLVGPYSPNNNLGTGSFTFEAWIYPTNIGGNRGVYSISGGSGANPKFVIFLSSGTPNIHYNNLPNGADIYTSASSAVSVNTWSHIAFVRNGSTWTWYINGVASGSGSNSTNITFTTQPSYVGYGGETFFTEFNGYIDDLRVTRGFARYTANFTPPAAAFPTK